MLILSSLFYVYLSCASIQPFVTSLTPSVIYSIALHLFFCQHLGDFFSYHCHIFALARIILSHFGDKGQGQKKKKSNNQNKCPRTSKNYEFFIA